MRYSTYLMLLLVTLGLASCNDKPTNTTSVYDQKADSLLNLMTLDEKVGQLNMYSGGWDFTGPVPDDANNQRQLENIKKGMVGGMLNVLTADGTRKAQELAVENSRLGIPLIFGYDVVHGYTTMFPIPLAQAASWDAESAKLGSKVAAQEAAASGLHWTFAPMVDISRDARWGRIMESAGEDPYLASVMAKAWVEGYQGDDLSDPLTIAACAKHFAAYGFAEAGRDYNTVDISRNTLFNVVLPPFKAASDAGVATFMNAFNEISGEPATGSAFLQRDILKGAWGFNGFVVSDWASIGELMTHGFAKDSAEAGRIALLAGSDMDMESKVYEHHLKDLIKSGKVNEKLLDDAVKRILKVKFQLGLFDDPYRYCDTEREASTVYSPKNRETSREIAHSTMVLLKNEGKLLPISKKVKTIAVIGDLAASKDVPLGSWRAQAIQNSAVSLVDGIKEAAGDHVKVTYAQGYKLTEGPRDFVHELTMISGDHSGFSKAISLARNSDVVIMALGEDCFQSGEGRSQGDISLKGDQLELLKAVIKVNPNVVAVLMNGRPIAIPYVAEHVPAILETWFAGSESGNAIADVLFGKQNPSGKLPVSFPRHTGQEPLYYNQKNTGRPITNAHDDGLVFWSHYTDMPKTPQWAFGHGLSYTDFEYSDLKVSPKGGGTEVSITLKNTGDYDGAEVAQVYIRDMHASLTQPIKRLVDFTKIYMQKGDQITLSFMLTEEDFGFYHLNQQFYAESGTFQIFVGGSSDKVLTQSIELTFDHEAKTTAVATAQP